MSASGLRVSLPQDRAVLELVKALVLLLLTLSVCTAVITLPQCSLSEYYDTDEKAYYALNCGSGRLYALPCTEHSQGFTYGSYRCSDGSEEPVGITFTGLLDVSVTLGWSCTVSWGYRDDDNPWGDERHLEDHCTVTAAPDLQRGPAVQKAMADTPATLLCGTNLTGYPEVTVEWRDNNGTTLTNETNGFTLMHGPQIALIIDPARLEDSGRWVCVLKNTEGSKEVEINLQVGVPPNISRGNKTTVAVFSPSSALLECVTNLTGHPLPNVTWIHNGTIRDLTSYNEGDAVMLNITETNINDTGQWACSIDNGFGNTSGTPVYLFAYSLPSKPLNLSLKIIEFPSASSTGSIQLSWTAPMDEGWPKYSFYDITCLPHDTVLPMVPANSTSAVLTELRNATYVITLAAVSVAGGLEGRGLPTDIEFDGFTYSSESSVPTAADSESSVPTAAGSSDDLIISLTVVGLLLILLAVIATTVICFRKQQLKWHHLEVKEFELQTLPFDYKVDDTASISTFLDNLELEKTVSVGEKHVCEKQKEQSPLHLLEEREYNSSSSDLGLSFAVYLKAPPSPPTPHVDHFPSLGQCLIQDKQHLPSIPHHASVEQSRKDQQQQADNSIPGPTISTDNNITRVSFIIGEDSHSSPYIPASNPASPTYSGKLSPVTPDETQSSQKSSVSAPTVSPVSTDTSTTPYISADALPQPCDMTLTLTLPHPTTDSLYLDPCSSADSMLSPTCDNVSVVTDSSGYISAITPTQFIASSNSVSCSTMHSAPYISADALPSCSPHEDAPSLAPLTPITANRLT